MNIEEDILAAPLLDDIERQLDRDIASLLKLNREEAACLVERIDMPLMELLEEHHAAFARPDWPGGSTEPPTRA